MIGVVGPGERKYWSQRGPQKTRKGQGTIQQAREVFRIILLSVSVLLPSDFNSFQQKYITFFEIFSLLVPNKLQDLHVLDEGDKQIWLEFA